MTSDSRPRHRILTINAQGLRGSESRVLLFEWLSCVGADIVCIQEMHATSAQEFSSWVEDYNARAVQHQKWCCESSPGSARSCGVAILYHPAFQVLNVRRDDSGRLVVVELSGNNFDFQVMCFYAPNARDEGRQFFESFIAASTLTFRS